MVSDAASVLGRGGSHFIGQDLIPGLLASGGG